jgi:hypothetical protein
MNRLILYFTVLLFFLAPLPSGAAFFQGGETVLSSGHVEEDVYLAGGKVIADQTTGEDLVAAGGNLLVNGAVGKDLIVAGGSITVNAPVGDDLRASGGEITITGPVGDDLVVAGGSITISSGATVNGDLVATGGSILIAGTVKGNVRAAGGEITVRGAVHGKSDFRAYKRLEIDSRLEGDSTFAARRIKLGSKAAFGGDVEYWQQKGKLDFSGVPTAGTVSFNPKLRFHIPVLRGLLGLAGLWLGFALLSGALLIFILVVAASGWFTAIGERLQDEFWRKFGYGLLYFLLMPMVALVCFITVIGAPLGFFILCLYGFSLYFAASVAALVLAKWIEARRAGSWGKPFFFLVSLLLFIILKLLLFIPAVGWIAAGIFICAAFGAIVESRFRNPVY